MFRRSKEWHARSRPVALAAASATLLQVPMCVPLDPVDVQFQVLTLLREVLVAALSAAIGAAFN